MEDSQIIVNGSITHLPAMDLDDAGCASIISNLPADERGGFVDSAIRVGVRHVAGAQDNKVIALTEQLSAAARQSVEKIDAAALRTGVATEEVNKRLRDIFDEYLATDGKFVESIDKLVKGLAGNLDPNSETVLKIRLAVAEEVKKSVIEPMGQVFTKLIGLTNINDEDSAVGTLFRLVNCLKEDVARVSVQIDKQNQINKALDGQSNIAGEKLEDFYESAIQKVCTHRNERLEDARSVDGLLKRKTGDYVTIINERTRLVAEAKNRKSFSVSQLSDELDLAMENRGALAAVGILTNPRSPGGHITLHGDNKVIVWLPQVNDEMADPRFLETMMVAAHDVARLLAIAKSIGQNIKVIDVARLNELLDDFRTIFTLLTSLKRNHTQVKTAVSVAEKTAEGIHSQVASIEQELVAVVKEAELEIVSRAA